MGGREGTCKEMATMMAKFRDTEATTCSISHKKRKFRGKREARRLQNAERQ